MKELILFNMISLDGFFAGPGGELDWHNVDAEFNTFAIDQFRTSAVDTLLFGRVTHQLMAAYWPTAEACEGDPVVVRIMNETPKLVFSRTLTRVEWENTRLVPRDAAGEIAERKKASGGNLMLLGSARLAATLSPQGLIDEYRLMVNPVLLGSGRAHFSGFGGRQRLRLVGTRTFLSGKVLLSYRPN